MENENRALKNDDEITPVIYGLVLRLPVETIPKLKEFLMGLPETRIIYQRKSLRLLHIEERP
jgi:hypothetical protein